MSPGRSHLKGLIRASGRHSLPLEASEKRQFASTSANMPVRGASKLADYPSALRVADQPGTTASIHFKTWRRLGLSFLPGLPLSRDGRVTLSAEEHYDRWYRQGCARFSVGGGGDDRLL